MLQQKSSESACLLYVLLLLLFIQHPKGPNDSWLGTGEGQTEKILVKSFHAWMFSTSFCHLSL